MSSARHDQAMIELRRATNRRHSARRAVTAFALGAVITTATACGAASAGSPVPHRAPPASAAVAPRGTKAALRALDRYTAIATKRYDSEVAGPFVHTQLQRLAHDAGLLKALRSGNTATLRSYVRTQFDAVWYHWHVSRMRIVSGSKVLSEVGVPFALAGQQTTLRSASGTARATLQISVQDEIGIVKAMHRHYPVDVVIRGSAAGHVVTLLQAAKQVKLPSSGTVTISGLRYRVRSFQRRAFGGEPVTVTLLVRA